MLRLTLAQAPAPAAESECRPWAEAQFYLDSRAGSLYCLHLLGPASRRRRQTCSESSHHWDRHHPLQCCRCYCSIPSVDTMGHAGVPPKPPPPCRCRQAALDAPAQLGCRLKLLFVTAFELVVLVVTARPETKPFHTSTAASLLSLKTVRRSNDINSCGSTLCSSCSVSHARRRTTTAKTSRSVGRSVRIKASPRERIARVQMCCGARLARRIAAPSITTRQYEDRIQAPGRLTEDRPGYHESW